MPKQWRTTPMLLVAVMVSIFIAACGSSGGSSTSPTATSGSGTSSGSVATPTGAYTCVSGSLSVSGSTALQPLVQAVASDYQAKCSGANITVNGGGSGTGLSQAQSAAVGIGDSDVYKKSAQPDLVDHQVAVVIFALILNNQVTGVPSLTTEQLKGIYSGSITNWNQVGGPNLAIVAVTRPANSGTRQTFQNYVLGGVENPKGSKNLQTDSTGAVITAVKQTAGAIGYAALGSAKSSGLTLLNIDGQAPMADLAKNNTYKFWNIEHMYTKEQASGLAAALINYMGSDQGKQEASNLSFVPIANMQASALQGHTK